MTGMWNPDGIQAMMVERATARPLATLCEALLILDAKDNLDDAERLTRAVLIDAICGKCPEADAAFDKWAEGDDEIGAVQVIVEAALQALEA